jgi:ornithine cyclodeaminase/alanine dehydrogenase-like protein (mu-crystallin family)
MFPFFTGADIRNALRWNELIAAMENTLVEFSTGRFLQPVRSVITIEQDRRYFGLMPAVSPEFMGLKAVTFYPGNANTGIPTHMAIVLLFRTRTGEPLAAMDGTVITEMRTAAVSAAVTNRLASPESHILAILGSGVQAKAHLEALKHVRKIDEVRVWSPNPEHTARFARENGAIATGAESAVRGADVVVTATAATQPILKGEWLKPGAHVNAVGANRPSWRELDDRAMTNAIVVDSCEAALKESGDIILSGAQIYCEVGEIFAGLKRTPESQTTIFKSQGIAAEDIAAAQLVWHALGEKSDVD